MKKILSSLDRFFFKEVSASGFGLMRIVWAFTVLLFALGTAPDIVRYYSDAGIIPPDVSHLVFRSEYRFTLLSYITEPNAVIALWCTFILATFCAMVGIWTRATIIVAALLLFSFHERNLQPLGGGDTVLRNLGFLLMIAPELKAFSLDRLNAQWKHWKSTGAFLAPLRTSIWCYRLVLWQILVIYVLSALDKLMGDMWMNGTVVEAVFHHTHFARYSPAVMNAFVWISPFASCFTLVFEIAWLLLLVPKGLWYVLPDALQKQSLRRWLLAGGLLFHWGIFVFMDVGSFPFAMSAGFCGMLLDEDFTYFKRVFNRKWKGKITILYDGICNLCQRSIFIVQLMDVLCRVRAVDFRDAAQHAKYAPSVSEADLDRAMHIKTPKGTYYKGFDAFRVLTWHLPTLRFVTPFLYLPGIPPLGRKIYQKIAERRNRCAGGVCVHKH